MAKITVEEITEAGCPEPRETRRNTHGKAERNAGKIQGSHE